MYWKAFVTAVVLSGVSCSSAPAVEPVNIGSRPEPLVDDFLVEGMRGVLLVLHAPTPREVAVAHDKPWEGNVCGYHTVFRDGDQFRMYYRGWHYDVKGDRYPFPFVTCYAESKDGIHWIKPELGLIDFGGSKKNNIIWTGQESHNFAPFKDANPACKPEQRYKALGLNDTKGGLVAFQSADGVHWSLLHTNPLVTKGAFDSQNVAFWDQSRQRYVMFWRGLREGRRDILTATSTDFLHWTESVWLEYPGAAGEELYTNQILVYDRAPHLLLGFPMRYIDSRRLQLPVGTSPNAANGSWGLTDGLFMTSRDGVNFHRWSEALIRPGQQPDRWITRNNCTAHGILVTKSDLPDAPEELSLYSTEGYCQGDVSRLRRFTIRLDGFVSLHANGKGGDMQTRPLIFNGKTLAINFSTSAAGSIRVEIQDASGKPIRGFTLDDCPEIYGDQIAQVVAWKTGPDVSRLAGQPIRLRFVLRDADLYAIRFQ
jgi:hypothetical protein